MHVSIDAGDGHVMARAARHKGLGSQHDVAVAISGAPADLILVGAPK